MNDQTMLFLCGVYALGFAIFHTQFWRLFKWKEELRKLSSINRGIMQILNLRLIYFFVFVAASCFFFPDVLATTAFGNFFLLGISLFCLGRTIEQFIFIKTRHPLAQLLTYLFIFGTILFAIPVLL